MKEETPEKKTTFDVLMSFIEHDETGAPDATRLFTQECFSAWVESRKKKLQSPEQAFHRVFLTHLRGADTRKPFPSAIEQAILKILRHPSCNPWEKMFANSGNSFNVGKHGFKQLAFHERQPLETDCQSSVQPQARKTQRPLTKKSKVASPESKIIISEFEAEDENLNNNDFIIRPQPSPDFPLSPDIIYRSYLSESTLNSNDDFISPWDRLCDAMIKYKKPHFLKIYLESAELQQIGLVPKYKIDLLPPAVIWFLKQNIPLGDIRYEKHFLFPQGDEKKFLSERPIGTYIVEPNTCTILDADAIAREITESRLTGDFIFAHNGSLFEFWLCMPDFLRLSSTGGEFSRRLLFRCDSGKIKLLLLHGVLIKGVRVTKVQDISDLFPEVVKRPFFI